MPGRNLEKIYLQNSYYHVYNRGVNRRRIFLDDQDYRVFLNLLRRYLSLEPFKDEFGRTHPHLRPDIDLLAYCLMPNHYHLLLYNKYDRQAMTKLIHSLATSYSMYFNKRYKRVGPLFQSRFRAVQINNDAYLWHISRYIHLNPFTAGYKTYPYSSYQFYIKPSQTPEWLASDSITGMFASEKTNYAQFVSDYEAATYERKLIEAELY